MWDDYRTTVGLLTDSTSGGDGWMDVEKWLKILWLNPGNVEWIRPSTVAA